MISKRARKNKRCCKRRWKNWNSISSKWKRETASISSTRKSCAIKLIKWIKSTVKTLYIDWLIFSTAAKPILLWAKVKKAFKLSKQSSKHCQKDCPKKSLFFLKIFQKSFPCKIKLDMFGPPVMTRRLNIICRNGTDQILKSSKIVPMSPCLRLMIMGWN